VSSNYDSVLSQLRAIGLEVESLEVGRIVRCHATGDKGRQRTGWYSLHEIQAEEGGTLIVGAFGDWRHGVTETGRPKSYRVEVAKSALSAEAHVAIAARMKADRARADALRKAEQARAAKAAQRAWSLARVEGHCAYLDRKRVGAHGVRFSGRGNLIIPMTDNRGAIHGLQIVYGDPSAKEAKGRDKEYWPRGMTKRGHYHLIGGPTDLVLIAEGYATAASIHEATGLPVAIAFDAGNLLPVAQALAARYKRARLLLCADDDYQTPGNPGATAAHAASLAVSGAVFTPRFAVRAPGPDDPPVAWVAEKLPAASMKLTDCNDLAVAEGLHVLRAQIEDRLSALGWIAATSGSATVPARGIPIGAEGDNVADRPLRLPKDATDLVTHFAKIYGTETVWDGMNSMVIKLAALRTDVPNKESVREWQTMPARRSVRLEDVGFDPSGADPAVLCNLWTGWPTTPRKGSCERLLELLRYLCAEEDNAEEIYQWVLRWLAYPLQHPGAKMQTGLLVHGEEGSGKNLFFGAIRKIYGRYGGSINQDDLEDKFNDWASAKLFMIANEVVTRVELYHVQGKLKNMITEPEWLINPKNLPRRAEQNHCNFVFFSNRIDIAKLDKQDRRYAVVWTPGPLGADFYQEVAAELKDGGSAALHHYLLHLDLGDFSAHAKPPMTRAKRELIDLGLDNTERFYLQWIAEQTEWPVVPAKSDDVYSAYKRWAHRNGIPKYAPSHIFLSGLGKRADVKKNQEWVTVGQTQKRRMVVFPNRLFDPPAGQTRQRWITDCADQFAAALGGDYDP
jgi:putative DNA primase/helicase